MYEHIHSIPSKQQVAIDNNTVSVSVLWEYTKDCEVVKIELERFWKTDLDWARGLLRDKEQRLRVEKAELSFPIIVDNTSHPSLIWDGNHRIAKALLLGLKTVKAVELTQEMEDKIFW